MNHVVKQRMIRSLTLLNRHVLKTSVQCLSTSPHTTLPHVTARYSPPMSSYQSNTLTLSRPPHSLDKPQDKMPPGHKATVGHLKTFQLPETVEICKEHIAMGQAMVEAWRKTTIFQISMTPMERKAFLKCLKVSGDFFKLPLEEKSRYVDDQSFAGYIASGDEITSGLADYSETFTITKDLPQTDPRVQARWPCHGPCPWPIETYKNTLTDFMNLLNVSGEKLLQLTALGLGLKNMNAFKELTRDGWHHMRNLRLPKLNETSEERKEGRGIGSHTDYGLVVIAALDLTGGDFVRPRLEGESIEEWQRSAAGVDEDANDEKWLFVPPIKNTMTVFPGDMMQHLTSSIIPATPHKVGLNTTERHALAYFHEPNFNAVIEPLPELIPQSELSTHQQSASGTGKLGFGGKIHYGTHFTEQFLRNYPTRITTERIARENRMSILKDIREKAFGNL